MMINLSADKTYRVIYYILNSKEFTQTEVHKRTEVSIGRVNKIVSWLLDKGHVEKLKGRYRLVSPISLINLLSSFRSMEKIASLDIDAPREDIIKFLVENKVVFCLTSALQYYDSYFRDPSICVYSYHRGVVEELKKFRTGTLRIIVYKPDMLLDENTETIDSIRLTSEIRTIIDLFCDNKAYAADRLIKRVFG